MPSTPYVPIHAIAQYKRGEIDEINHSIKSALISGEASFLDADNYSVYNDISGELYPITGGHEVITLANSLLTEDNANDQVDTVYDDPTWTGSGEGFGPIGGAVFWDDNSADKTIVGLLRFDDSEGNPTTFNISGGQQFRVRNILFRGKFI